MLLRYQLNRYFIPSIDNRQNSLSGWEMLQILLLAALTRQQTHYQAMSEATNRAACRHLQGRVDPASLGQAPLAFCCKRYPGILERIPTKISYPERQNAFSEPGQICSRLQAVLELLPQNGQRCFKETIGLTNQLLCNRSKMNGEVQYFCAYIEP